MNLYFWRKRAKENPLLIVKREDPEPHFEVHFDRSVEFWNLKGEKIGESKVHRVT
jgi:hypothetical protein